MRVKTPLTRLYDHHHPESLKPVEPYNILLVPLRLTIKSPKDPNWAECNLKRS